MTAGRWTPALSHSSLPATACEAAKAGWGARIRTWGWRNQNPLPYHLATPQKPARACSYKSRAGLSNQVGWLLGWKRLVGSRRLGRDVLKEPLVGPGEALL